MLDAYRRLPLIQVLGDGHIATVDGMRFRVPVRSIHAGPNPRYFARGRGVTWLNYMSDQFAGLHAIVVPGRLRDSLMILDGLLELQSPADGGPSLIITDQASYSDQIFGLFWLLGYQFSPRPAGLPDQRFWRTDPSLSTSGETLTIEESMTLRARTENAGDVGVEHEWSWGSG